MIIAGSVLMVYNIARYAGFVKRMRNLRSWHRSTGTLIVPLVLLGLFLVGYLLVAFFGEPDLVIASILLGGSVFVLIVQESMYDVVERLREEYDEAESLYSEAKSSLDAIALGYLAAFRVDVSRDEVEESLGAGLADGMQAQTYSELVEMRWRCDESRQGKLDAAECPLSRGNLLLAFRSGQNEVEERLHLRTEEGPTFIKLHMTLAAHPETGDVVGFVTESVCNDELVNETLQSKALTGQYDMITSILDGEYEVVIGERDVADRSSIFPANPRGSYERYLRDQVWPVLVGDEAERSAQLAALRLDAVEDALAVCEPYEVNVSCALDGKVRYKRFVFYVVDRRARFYLLLKSDTTNAREEEMVRNEVLTDALEQARRADASKTTFLSNVSHDIRTPMNAIVGYTGLAKRAQTFDEMYSYLEKIDTSSAYMLDLLNDVLEMSRIESGRMDLLPEDTDLVALLDGVRDMFETQMAEKGVTYIVDASGVRDRRVMCDRSRLNRVLLNLVSNSYKFTQAGGSVWVTLSQVESSDADLAAAAIDESIGPRGSYELRVQDTGIGMSEEFSHKVFDTFERERTSATNAIQGTGLGMAITKSFVDLMGGTIEVESELGQGTEFVVRLTFELVKGAPSASEAPVGAHAQDDAVRIDATSLAGLRVLLVEDNEINREIALVLFEGAGLVVQTATNGREALEMLVAAEDPYDLVVTDIQMPVMDGYEEARAIRALEDERLSRVPIVAMSANAFEEDQRAALAAGMNDYITKPIDLEVALATLVRVMSR